MVRRFKISVAAGTLAIWTLSGWFSLFLRLPHASLWIAGGRITIFGPGQFHDWNVRAFGNASVSGPKWCGLGIQLPHVKGAASAPELGQPSDELLYEFGVEIPLWMFGLLSSAIAATGLMRRPMVG